MLGPEASLKDKLRLETRMVELLEDTAKNPLQREKPDPFNSTQSSATSVSTFDRRTRLCTEQNCDDNTNTMVTNEMQRLFFIDIVVRETNPLTNNNNPYSKASWYFFFFWYISSYCMFWSKPRATLGLYTQKFWWGRWSAFPRGPLRVAFWFDFWFYYAVLFLSGDIAWRFCGGGARVGLRILFLWGSSTSPNFDL